ncbi:phosphoribosylformylglycinamidine synthase subunit PurS [Thermotoga sp. SG1]|uniref:phosphoribosylformylglycinamidine synthase subunit PurS n=1 Tax=Thermotoga sp. SG1 TaxID=126739 RepID=UPI000C77A1CE|nr:phosphoribosylformylglycinamidine synthase subunit PurS [Thermotoga sp. SG1]PLV56265.1 phosphoribosylformylglycinamidine synthase [Thermotoga sp. SG1]
MPIFKFAVDVQYRSNIRDPRGETIERVLREEKNLPVKRLRLGKSIHLEVEAEDREKAYEIVKKACDELLVNPVVEEYEVREL